MHGERGCRRSPARPDGDAPSDASGSSAIGRPIAVTMKRWASAEIGKPPASHEPQTTPPAAPENETIPSRSPQRAQAPSSGANPAASASFSLNARPSARGSGPRRPRPSPSPDAGTLVEHRQVAAEQVVGGPVRFDRVEQPEHGVAAPRRRVDRRAVGAEVGIAVDGRGAGHRAEVAAALVQHQVEAEERLEATAEARLRPSASPSRSRSRGRDRPCRGGGSGPPRRSGCCAALRPLS